MLLVVTPASAGASATGHERPAIVAEGLPAQCVVPNVSKMSVGAASMLLMQLGCRVRVVYEPSKLRKGRVVGAVGGVSSYPYLHRVTLVVSSGT